MEKSDVLHRRLLIVVCAVCACVRVFLVWNTRFMLDPDAGVVALMAKHMAEGVGFPVFFYGQPYMGSLEPAVSAALFIIFGASELALCAGTALIGLCVLPVAYLWARDAAGRWAGLAALVFLALGPAGYFPYLVVPRGGYAVIILAGTLVLWLSARILSVETRRERADWRLFAGLGLAAGAGWWTSALEAAAIGTAGLLFLCVMRRRLAAWRIFLAGLAFFAGGAPFWIWNIRHDWASFGYLAGGAQKAPFLGNLLKRMPERVLLLMGLDNVPGWWAALVLILLGLLLLLVLLLVLAGLGVLLLLVALLLLILLLLLLLLLVLFLFGRILEQFLEPVPHAVEVVPRALMLGVAVEEAHVLLDGRLILVDGLLGVLHAFGQHRAACHGVRQVVARPLAYHRVRAERRLLEGLGGCLQRLVCILSAGGLLVLEGLHARLVLRRSDAVVQGIRLGLLDLKVLQDRQGRVGIPCAQQAVGMVVARVEGLAGPGRSREQHSAGHQYRQPATHGPPPGPRAASASTAPRAGRPATGLRRQSRAAPAPGATGNGSRSGSAGRSAKRC